MREVVTHLWCDKHLQTGDHVDALTRQLGSDNRWYEVELCQECAKEMLGPLVDFLEEYGVKESSGIVTPPVLPEATHVPDRPAQQELPLQEPSRKTRKVRCIVPDCHRQMSVDYIGQHQKSMHGVDRAVLTLFCPLCDEEFDRTWITPHMQREHDSRIDEAYWRILDQGDPDGIVNARLKLAGWAG